MQHLQEIQQQVQKAFGLQYPSQMNEEEWMRMLASFLNELIQKDFQRLVSLLYRIDVSEAKLNYMLKQNPGTDAGLLIAELIVERQLQKIQSREYFKQQQKDADSAEEKW